MVLVENLVEWQTIRLGSYYLYQKLRESLLTSALNDFWKDFLCVNILFFIEKEKTCYPNKLLCELNGLLVLDDSFLRTFHRHSRLTAMKVSVLWLKTRQWKHVATNGTLISGSFIEAHKCLFRTGLYTQNLSISAESTLTEWTINFSIMTCMWTSFSGVNGGDDDESFIYRR